MSSNVDDMCQVICSAARNAFSAVRQAHPEEHFYYFSLVTTEDALRPGPSASSVEGLNRVLSTYREAGHQVVASDLRWSEADSPYDLFGDEYFSEVQRLFSAAGDHRDLPNDEYLCEVERRFAAMEAALAELDRLGVFGTGTDRHAVLINVVAPGDETEEAMFERAARLNPPESLSQLRKDYSLE